MLVTKLALVALLAGASAFPDFLTNPKFKWVDDWKAEAARRRSVVAAAEAGCPMAARLAMEKRDSVAALPAAPTATRGSQTGIFQPCFNVYQAPVPTDDPTAPGPDGTPNRGYQKPQTNDVRSPCPALNTLANHGYLPRDGRSINGTIIVDAFASGWGIDPSVISTPFSSALSVCSFFSGGQENDMFDDNANRRCDAFDLDVLNAPHQFEHDHSLSRNDYMPNFSNAPYNNHVFNGTIFNQSLAVLNNSCYMTIPQANEVRLTREVQQFLQDRPGWFTLAPGTQETEIGFIYAVMSENNQPGGSRQASNATVRVNWWQYWFMYESFPVPLGWQVPSPRVKNDFVLSVSASVISASIYSTPSPYFTEFRFGPTGTFPSTSKTGTPSFNPTLPNLYTTNPRGNKMVRAEATPTTA